VKKNLFFEIILTFATTLLFSLCTNCCMASDEWPMFKSNVASSSVNPSDALSVPFVLRWSSSVTIGNNNNAVAYSSPVVYDGQTYIGGIDGTLYAFTSAPVNHTNTPLWSKKTNAPIYGSPAVTVVGTSSPVTLVFVGGIDGNLYCFNAIGGGLQWAESLGGPVFSSPLIYSEGTSVLVACASHSGIVSAFNVTTPSSPTTAWAVTISNNYLFASPVYEKLSRS
jgi:outer membrane protein assembly factor BamB